MRKRIAYIMAGCLCVWLLAYGVIAASGRTPGQAPASNEITGTLIDYSKAKNLLRLEADGQEKEVQAAKSVWVYRDNGKAGMADLRAGDRLEIVLNGKQAAYIKAFSKDAQAAESAAPEAAAETPEPTAAASPSPSAEPAPTAAPSVQATAAPTPEPTARADRVIIVPNIKVDGSDDDNGQKVREDRKAEKAKDDGKRKHGKHRSDDHDDDHGEN